MLQFTHACVIFLCAHAVTGLFFHEKSSIVLTPNGENNISFGYSLGYQHGKDPNIVIGAPLYDMTGRVYQHSISEILSGRTSCDPLDIDFDALNITYDRKLSADQNFYLGASIASTEEFFMTTSPLRTAFSVTQYKNGTVSSIFGAFGACFIYDRSKKASACRDYGLEYFTRKKIYIKNYMYGGSGWSTMVDKDKKRIIVSKSFHVRDVIYGTLNVRDRYISLKEGNMLNITTDEKDITNYGKAMTLGNYFDKAITKTYYAFSFRHFDGRGAVEFSSSDNKWSPLKRRLEDNTVGSMFGASLCSADVTGDGRAELFVGAPAQAADATSCDRGAVHIYTKSDSSNRKSMVLKLTIWGVKDGARFGTTLSVNDVNGDSYPDIFISAPFENSGVGALYILCGYEIHGLIDTKKILVSEMRRMQRIEKETAKFFGFSLQPITDFNENGGNELAVGSPGNSRVTLYSGIRAIKVVVTSKFADSLQESDSGHHYLNFSSCVTVHLPEQPKTITTKLLMNNVLSGTGVFNNSDEATYEIDLATEEGNTIADNRVEYCKNMHIVDAFFCVVNTTVSTVENIQANEAFSNTWVTLSANSELTKATPATVFECLCQNVSCEPEFHTELMWSGRAFLRGLETTDVSCLSISPKCRKLSASFWSIMKSNNAEGKVASYLVGSSSTESVSVVVHNLGTKGCSSCAVVRVSGKLGIQLQCQATDMERQYKCELPNPFMGNTSHTIEIQLSMDMLSNRESNVTIDIEVRKNCDEPEHEAITSLTVLYSFADVLDNVIINGTSMDREVSDTEIENDDEELIHEQTYTILNNRSFIWKHIRVTITASNKPYIRNFRAVIKNTEKYGESNGTNFSWQSPLTLTPNSVYEVTIYTNILKKEIEPHHINGRLTITSELVLDLFPDKAKSYQLETVLVYKKEKTIWQNKTLITVIALIAALMVLVIITVILYKLNFFRRKNKEKLKQEIRRRSIRRENSQRRPLTAYSEAGTSTGDTADNTGASLLLNQHDVELSDASHRASAQAHEDRHEHCD